jgi:MFS transporter, MFS domain-containing protein family, molybdate-anion transporter
MNSYDSAFLVLITGCGALTWQQYRKKEQSPEEKALMQNAVTPRAKAEASQFTRLFLVVYCLVQASDWLQGMPSQFRRASPSRFTLGFWQGLILFLAHL